MNKVQTFLSRHLLNSYKRNNIPVIIIKQINLLASPLNVNIAASLYGDDVTH